MFRFFPCLFAAFLGLWFCPPAPAHPPENPGRVPDQPDLLAHVHWKTDPLSIQHEAQCSRRLSIPLPPACKGQDVYYSIRGTDPDQDCQCRLWVEYVKKSRSEASRLHVQGNTWYKGFMGSMTAATTRLVHVDCLSGRFTPMRISLTLHCAPSDRIDDTFARDLEKFIQTR